MLQRQQIASLRDLAALPYDEIIDVRAPAEFAEDHIPGALNLPVFSDLERAEVGTIYVQQDPFLARKVGAALVAKNAAAHLQGALADRPGSWRPLVYCWRGGQRSGSFASILDQIGWRVGIVEGGYKSYRRLVVQDLYETTIRHRIILLDGGTGTGKTVLLAALKQAGAQVLDLEAMAHHRGSVLGGYRDPQPAQKTFESHLALALSKCDPARPVFVEAESAKIGKVIVPPMMWQAMIAAEHIQISAPLSARAKFLVQAYGDVVEDIEKLCELLARLAQFHGHEVVKHWQDLATSGRYQDLAQQLIATHYDPSYSRSSRRKGAALAQVKMGDLSAQDLARVALQIIEITEG